MSDMAEAASGPQRARSARRWATLATALLAAACNTVVPRAPVEAPPAPPPPPPAPPPRPTTGVDDGLLQDSERDRVALLVPLTGPNAGVGQSIANATQLALLDTRSEKVRITTYDTGQGAAAAAQRALADGAQLILGPLLAEDVRRVLPIARGGGVPVVSFSNDASVAGQGSYLLGYSPAQSVARVVGYAKAHGATAFGGLMPIGRYGQPVSTAFLHAVEEGGGKVVALETFDRANGGVVTAAAKLDRAAPFDAVLVADSGATAAAAAVPLKRASPAAHLLGTELWNSEPGVVARPQLQGAWFASVSNALYRQYAARYRARFASAPYRLSSLGYDAVLLTVRIARDWPVGSRFPEARLRDRGGFSGIDGAFRFGRDGVAERALEVQEIRGGTGVLVSPAPAGFDER